MPPCLHLTPATSGSAGRNQPHRPAPTAEPARWGLQRRPRLPAQPRERGGRGTRCSARRAWPGVTGARSVPHPFPCTHLSATDLLETVNGIVGARCPCQRLLETRCPRRCPPQLSASGPQTSGSPEGVTRPEDARERPTVLWLTCPPRPRLCAGVPPPGAGKISGCLPPRCAGRSRPPGSYGVAGPPRPSRRRGRPPARAPPPHRPGWAEDQPRPRPRPRPGTRQPVGGAGQRPAAGATLHPPGVSSIPGPRAPGSGDISGPRSCCRPETVVSQRNQPRRPCYLRPHPQGGPLLCGLHRPLPLGPPFPCRPPWGLLPAESNAEQGRPVTNLNSNPSPLGRPCPCSTWRAPDPVPGPLGPQAPDGRPGPSVAPCAAPSLGAVSRRDRRALPVAREL
ncbi:hypothetical protein GH733_004654 [Mirounga leonina]|nr:hypothetical protein GH733_004654 [Mirounga leonina]